MDFVTKILTVSDASTAYNLELGFKPTFVEVFNLTQWAADSKNTYFYWYEDMGDGYYKGVANLATQTTNGRKAIAGTSNGFTAYDSSSFAARQGLIDTGSTKISKATNAVVTSTAHGMSTGDKVTFQGIYVGMTEINGLSTKITYLTADTFSCDDIDSTGFTTWDSSLATGQFIKTSDLVLDAGKKGVTLGTTILGTNADVLMIRAYEDGNYAALTQA